ncbi:MAG TPA: hypothetical protein DDY39_14595 [Nitrospira sp.]|nr:hypothetical protein [Nitrospira sp.]
MVLVNLVVYLIRSPREMISPFLYPKMEDVTIIAVEKTLVGGKVVQKGIGCLWEREATLSYSEVLELLIQSQQVIAL